MFARSANEYFATVYSRAQSVLSESFLVCLSALWWLSPRRSLCEWFANRKDFSFSEVESDLSGTFVSMSFLMVLPFLTFFIRVYQRPFPKLDTHRCLLQASSFEDRKKILTREKTFGIINSVKLNYYVNQGQSNGY